MPLPRLEQIKKDANDPGPVTEHQIIETRFVGIDPGKSGGIAVLRPFGNHDVFSLEKMTDREVWERLKCLNSSLLKPCAVIEKNTGFISGRGYAGGVGGNPGSSMFKFGIGTGKLLGYLVAADIPHEERTPQQWQKAVGVPARTKSQTPADYKRVLKQHAERLYPGMVLTLKTADALLIAHYCKLRHGS